MRSRAIRALKQAVWLGMEIPSVSKLLRLISDERTIYLAAKAAERAAPVLSSLLPGEVMRGPFAGLLYPSPKSQGSGYWTKILGSYEAELHKDIEAACTTRYSLIIDIGAAEGYYAVGMARRCPSSHVIAFEGTTNGRDLLLEMIRANGVEGRVEVHGWCGPADLDALEGSMTQISTLVICDAEGSEYRLLDPARLPALAGCDLIVELHSYRGIQARDWIVSSFESTHDISFVDVAPRQPLAYPELASLEFRDRSLVLFERTDDLGWAVMQSRAFQRSSNRPLNAQRDSTVPP